MSDAVLRVRSHLQNLVQESWTDLENQHVSSVSWLHDELAQIAQSLEIKAPFDPKASVAVVPYPRTHEDTFTVLKPTKKKAKIESPRENEVSPASEPKRCSVRTRLSMRLCVKAQSEIVREKKTRKRARSSERLLEDPTKLKVVDLRLELKKRGLRTTGRKVALLDRLLNILEVEQRENARQEPKEQNEMETHDDKSDEIVRESVDSTKSVRSQLISPISVDQKDKELDDRSGKPMEVTVIPRRNSIDALYRNESSRKSSNDISYAAANDPKNLTQGEVLKGNDEREADIDGKECRVEVASSEKAHKKDVQNTKDLTDMTCPAWTTKSILRKVSYLAPCSRPTQNVSFAPNTVIDLIAESSPTRFSQSEPEMSPEPKLDVPETTIKQIVTEEEVPFKSGTSTKKDFEKKTVSIPDANSALTTEKDTLTSILVSCEEETEVQRKKREFDESVQREAQKLRTAAKLSAQKRLEEAKASKTFWAKRDQLNAKLRASSADDKQKAALVRVASSEQAKDFVSPSSSTVTEGSSSSFESSTLLALVEEKRTQQTTSQGGQEDAIEGNLKQTIVQQHPVVSTPIVSCIIESSRLETSNVRSTVSVLEDKQQVERINTCRSVEKPAAKSMSSVVGLAKGSLLQKDAEAPLELEPQQPKHSISALSTVKAFSKGTDSINHSELQMLKSMSTWTRSDSLSSTVSSINEPCIVENALKASFSTALKSLKKPNSQFTSEMHVVSSLNDRNDMQPNTNGRLAPVVNALKLAEKSRIAEEKKRLEKEKRKAFLKQKMEEHKQVAAIKEKAEKDAQAKREQDRLNDRKKREAELARRRQQKLKEMRAGLEKKRAMLAAEAKSRLETNAAMALTSAASAPLPSHHKHRGLSSATEADYLTANIKPLQKAMSKPVSKPIPSQPPPTASRTAPKPAPKLLSSSESVSSLAHMKPISKSHTPEIITYEMSDNIESSDSGSESGQKGNKKVPRWAQRDHLNKILHAQFGKNAIDPSPAIFKDFVDTCNLEAIFETSDASKKKKFARRTSSGNWLADRPTARDKALYQREMGYDR
ncbi:uncharacterized protein CCR75_009036 [Bremia lactucae]|uniref:SAP domain-containing protein n=1 Tax=Bremia lactucae TaxID=4779 RepID=A0A976NY22_BRELC|nr:hypothetical protein CCR75_009036 [Bremia lactucae]